MHPDLRLAGSLPSLDMPHHLRANEWCRYREGVTFEGGAEEKGQKKKKRKETRGVESATLVDVGLPQKVSVQSSIPPKTRVTISLPDNLDTTAAQESEITGTAVSPDAPREEAGYYWGYSVRSASSLSAVVTECSYLGGYDLTFGTSERGVPISSLLKLGPDDASVPQFKHMLVVFGGVTGLETAVSADKELQKLDVTKPADLFDYWVNLCPGQGSRTIRTEEAVWLGLMGLREVVMTKGIR